MNVPGVNCAWTYGGPNISQAVLIFQKNKFQGIHVLQLLHGTLVWGGGSVTLIQDGSAQLQDVDPYLAMV